MLGLSRASPGEPPAQPYQHVGGSNLNSSGHQQDLVGSETDSMETQEDLIIMEGNISSGRSKETPPQPQWPGARDSGTPRSFATAPSAANVKQHPPGDVSASKPAPVASSPGIQIITRPTAHMLNTGAQPSNSNSHSFSSHTIPPTRNQAPTFVVAPVPSPAAAHPSAAQFPQSQAPTQTQQHQHQPPQSTPATWTKTPIPKMGKVGSTPAHTASASWNALGPHLGGKFLRGQQPNTLYQALYKYPVVRELRTASPGRFSPEDPFRIIYYIHLNAALVQVTGEPAPEPCQSCVKFGYFEECILPPRASWDDLPGPACASCIGRGRSPSCCYSSDHQRAPKYNLTGAYSTANKVGGDTHLKRQIKNLLPNRSPARIEELVRLALLSDKMKCSVSTAAGIRQSFGGNAAAATVSQGTPSCASKETPRQPLLDPEWFGDGDEGGGEEEEPRFEAIPPSVTLLKDRVPSKRKCHDSGNLLSLRVKQLKNMSSAEVAQMKMEMSIWEAAFSVVDAEDKQVNIAGVTKTRVATEMRLTGAAPGEVQVVANGHETDADGYSRGYYEVEE